MKKILIVLGLIISSTTFSQKLTFEGIKLENTGYFIKNSTRIITSPQAVFHKNKSYWSAGPVIHINSQKEVSQQTFPALNGMEINYRFYPIESSQKINFYLYADLIFQVFKTKWTAYEWDSNINSYQPYDYKNRELFITPQVGYGIEYKFGKRLQISNSVGLGAYYANTKGEATSVNSPEIPFLNKNINGFKPVDFSWQVKLSVKYSF